MKTTKRGFTNKKAKRVELSQDEFAAWNRGQYGLRAEDLKRKIHATLKPGQTVQVVAPNGDALFYVYQSDNPHLY